MATITFQTEDAHCAFHSMAEGMWEIARDDHVSPTGEPGPQAERYERLIAETAVLDGAAYPVTFTISAEALATTEAVMANLQDNEDEIDLTQIQVQGD